MANKQFIEFYYKTFDADRKQLGSLYVGDAQEILLPTTRLTDNLKQREQSMLTFESASVLGVQNIVDKLSSLPFEKVAHQVGTLDAQPTMVDGGIIILVTGQLLVDEEQRPMNYTQAFQLARDEQQQYFVYNDIFKLVYG
ncbi:Nuclear transport factor-like protein [Hapsidospora chrysogenum ATCC 11550]|uniref:NTF2-related export protein n=1 Tax=Hapsidospora chrysogenum (strain ATCC 11550 / CBS 779.69 / DSM 880 / IAM 14645 / JCM 23072 / IMI 49137) TaxID=857340 RepID=A0A086SV36_HAPC1|nr:Nuclear transport factor-like protein [Hapsidospora chrysogenum ATCC 11550]